MDERARLDQASERKTDVAASARKPWHAPVIDIVPVNATQIGANNTTDGSNQAC